MKKSQTQTFLGTFAIILASFFMMSASGCDQNGPSNSPRKAIIHTDLGDITVVLSDSTPEHRDNFIKLAQEGFYDNLLFHRVMQGFMVQGGDPKSLNADAGVRLGGGGPGYTIDRRYEVRPCSCQRRSCRCKTTRQCKPGEEFIRQSVLYRTRQNMEAW